MASITNAIKKAVVPLLENYDFADYRIGEVVNTSPIEIKITEKLTLKPVQLFMLESAVGEFPVTVDGKSGKAKHSLKKGDIVALGMFQGGQQYLVFGKVKKL
ncbi:DUF2577 family protein [Peptostreptococcus faecalis]|uniref:DUF2577 family protein n=1 Tax=Peptostreptococcus faecalis TaxID=2045015 RepID=UPI000C79BEF2|nr:DUF2577 family protein [Peptostreptococcus faecalis]